MFSQNHLIKKIFRAHVKAGLKSFAKAALVICTYLAATAVSAQQLTITFRHMAGTSGLQPGVSYKNAFDETFTIRNLRYYISAIVLYDSIHNRSQSVDTCLLVDDRLPASKEITLPAALQTITGITFLLGVDSIKNVSGVQTGALDPAAGMFWTWNTGYVMAKLDGFSPAAKTPAHAFSYHIGGYKPDENVVKHIRLPLPVAVNMPGHITIVADVIKWFSGVHEIKIANAAFCHEPGKLAMKIAANYANMFSVETSP